ncbi:MAG: cysteine desulfurase [Myxococcota bacterium]|nr:cysteine desulfurase [Myxococcota bacterium]
MTTSVSETDTAQGLKPLREGDDARSWTEIREDFPVLKQRVHDKPLVYLDSAASSQMPQQVLDALIDYHSNYHSNVHRGVHTLSQRATNAYERARMQAARYINARTERELIFVRGATEGINLVMQTWGRENITEKDRILISAMEHHANIVPWQMLAERVGAKIDVIPMSDKGELDMSAYRELLGKDVKLVCVAHVSNALGTINPVEEIIALAHKQGAKVMVDGCQAAPHLPIDVQALDADFYTFSSHKMFGPTGIGVLYGKFALLEQMPPFQGGGDMIDTVSWEGTTYEDVPQRFEAGTPSIAAAVGMGAAIDYIAGIGRARIAEREHELLALATEKILTLDKIRVFGQAAHKAAVLSFDFEDIHPNDIGMILDTCGVAVRTGQHCAEPVMTRLGIHATARASFALYNNEDDVEAFIDGLLFVRDLFA